jgi:hypothetical protein
LIGEGRDDRAWEGGPRSAVVEMKEVVGGSRPDLKGEGKKGKEGKKDWKRGDLFQGRSDCRLILLGSLSYVSTADAMSI